MWKWTERLASLFSLAVAASVAHEYIRIVFDGNVSRVGPWLIGPSVWFGVGVFAFVVFIWAIWNFLITVVKLYRQITKAGRFVSAIEEYRKPSDLPQYAKRERLRFHLGKLGISTPGSDMLEQDWKQYENFMWMMALDRRYKDAKNFRWKTDTGRNFK